MLLRRHYGCPLGRAVSAQSPAYEDQCRRGQLFLHGLIFKGSGPDAAIVDRVEPNSPAAKQGLKPGDRVTAIDRTPIDSVEDAQRALMSIYGAGSVLTIRVAGDSRTKSWTLEDTLPRSRPVHPTQFYSLFDALLLCGFLLAYEPYKRRDGELTALVLTIHPVSRFLLEIIRVDESAVFNTGMSISQNISLAILAAGVGLWIYLLWRRPLGSFWPGRLRVNAASR